MLATTERGTCPVCGRQGILIRLDGRIRKHGDCSGVGQSPIEVSSAGVARPPRPPAEEAPEPTTVEDPIVVDAKPTPTQSTQTTPSGQSESGQVRRQGEVIPEPHDPT